LKKAKILHLTSHIDIGGITSWLLTATPGLAQRGHSVAVASGGGAMAPVFEQKGVRVFEFPVRVKSELHPALYASLPGLFALVRRERFDILHAHTRVTQLLAAFLSRLNGVPTVTTAHGYYKKRLSRRLFGFWGSRVIAVSPLVAQALHETHGVDPARVRVVPNAVDGEGLRRRLSAVDRVITRRIWGFDENSLVLASVSRLVEDKGHAYLIDAVDSLKKEMPHLALLILGDGRERAALQERIHRAGLESRVKLLPAVPDIAPVLSAADVFVHPATYREGFGLSLAEAMIAGKPVIVTDIPAVNSIIVDRVNGLVVAPKSAAALAKAIRFMAAHPVETRGLAEKGRADAERLASCETMLDGLEAVYCEVLEKARR
jgi:glycosyltransferase involved in cell wall biosynthesis